MGAMLQQTVLMAVGETPKDHPMETPMDSPVDGGEILGDPPIGIWSKLIYLLKERVTPQNWGGVGISEALELAPHKIGYSLGELSAREVAGTVDWVLLAALERVTAERDALLQEVAELEYKLWDAMRKERKLLKTEIVLLRDILVVQDGAEGECRL